MSDRSPIEWTDATWNPVRGCTKVSPGCKFCYAEMFAERFRGVPGHPFQQGFDLRLVPEKLDQPLRWKRPRKIFVNSMSDLFHEDVPAEYIARVGDVMRRADWHVFQVLTKRDERMRELLRVSCGGWLISRMLHTGSASRTGDMACHASGRCRTRLHAFGSCPSSRCWAISGQWICVNRLGDRRRRERPARSAMLREWVVNIRRQCRTQRVPFFFKQWGGTRKHETGRSLDGRTYDEFPLAFHRVLAASSA